MALFDVPMFWGGLRLWAQSGDVDVSRTLTPHELAQGDRHPLHDAGLSARPLRLSLLFDQFAGEAMSPEDRLQRLLELHRSGREYMFSHPIEGNFLAKIGALTYRHDDDSVITAEATFYPTDEDQPVSPAGAGMPAIAGEANVESAADDLDDLLADLEPSDLADAGGAITDAARTAVEAWSLADEVPTRQIMTDVAAISSSIADLQTTYELEDDLALFDVWLASVMLGEAVRAAAVGATSEVESVFTVRIVEPVVLLALSAQIYGGRAAETKERQIREMNGLRSSAWIGPGEFVFPAREA